MASPSLSAHPLLSQWLDFAIDGRATVRSGKVELGQGIATALIQIASDALAIAPDRIDLVSGDTAACPDEGFTASSLSIEVGGRALETVCTCARALFTDAAASTLQVPPATLHVDDGTFTCADGRALTYWQLLHAVDLAQRFDAAIDREVDDAVTRGPASLPLARTDFLAKFSGAAFIHDLSLPGMVFGRVLRPDHPHAALASFDPAPIRAMPGVVAVVVDGSFIALAAEREEQAVRALEAAERTVYWQARNDLPALADCADASNWLAGQTASTMPIVDTEARIDGPRAVRRFEADYGRPYLAHASIGPSCALAQIEGDALTVWSHSQGVHALRRHLAKALGRDLDAIRVIHRDGAGCYGHNGADDVALDAALLALACRRPVQVQWRRRDEFAAAPWGSAMHMRLSAEVGDTDRIVRWSHDVTSQVHVARPGRDDGVNLLAAWQREPPAVPSPEQDLPIAAGGGGARNAVPLYDFAQQRIVLHLVTGTGLRTSALRSLGAFGNVFAIESFVDEIAVARGRDPLAFRLRHLDDARAQAVLHRVAHMGRWDPARVGDGERGCGVALARYKSTGAYCAVMVEVELERALRVRSVFAAVDCGRVIHADGAKNQIEGGIVQAISWTLKEHLRWDATGVTTRSWDDYPILRFDEVPAIEVALLDRVDSPSLGVGECAAGPTAAAIANALAHASGIRVRHLPLTPERIARAMEPV